MPQDDDKTAFLECLAASFAGGTFVKAALGKYRGPGDTARCAISRVMLKDTAHLRLVTRQGTQDFTQNMVLDKALPRLAQLIGGDYLSAALFTTAEDVALVYNRKRVGHLQRTKPTMTQAPPAGHDRTKPYLVDATAPFLERLGITHAGHQVKPSMYAKYRQICRFVEILDQLLAISDLKDASLKDAPLKDAGAPVIVDIGSGKGYLTFALHEHLTGRLARQPRTLGIEANSGLVDQCNAVAADCGILGLAFTAASASSWAASRPPGDPLDSLIALHACDTATDDAIHLGLTSKASLIVCAPCCQHEIAPQITASGSPIEGLLKYGLLKQRQADLVTDAARALLLESQGYEVRVIEFVSTEHTAKNLLIAAVRSDTVDRRAAAAQYQRLAAFAGLQHHRLGSLLAQSLAGAAP